MVVVADKQGGALRGVATHKKGSSFKQDIKTTAFQAIRMGREKESSRYLSSFYCSSSKV